MRPKGSPEELERRRFRAFDLLKEGYTQAEVARMVGVTEAAVSAWRNRAARGREGLRAVPNLGRPPRLSSADLRKLEKILLKGPQEFGWPNNLWTCPRVAEVIRKTFRVKFHPDHVRKILVNKLGWSSQKPEVRARERDEKAIEKWRTEEFPRIKKTPKKKGLRSFSSTNRVSC